MAHTNKGDRSANRFMSDSAKAPEITPLQERLTQLVKLNGPMTVADYMTDALGHPHDG